MAIIKMIAEDEATGKTMEIVFCLFSAMSPVIGVPYPSVRVDVYWYNIQEIIEIVNGSLVASRLLVLLFQNRLMI